MKTLQNYLVNEGFSLIESLKPPRLSAKNKAFWKNSIDKNHVFDNKSLGDACRDYLIEFFTNLNEKFDHYGCDLAYIITDPINSSVKVFRSENKAEDMFNAWMMDDTFGEDWFWNKADGFGIDKEYYYELDDDGTSIWTKPFNYMCALMVTWCVEDILNSCYTVYNDEHWNDEIDGNQPAIKEKLIKELEKMRF